MKAKVDLEKFICSYVKYNNIQDALKDQGLKCWRGEIVEIPQDSEDERIKKEILDLISISGNGNQFEEIKDWLEYKPQGKSALEAIKEEKSPVESLGISPEKYEEIVNECIYGEEKPTDKVEPKFKVGDFIANDYCFGKVIEITNDAYLLDTGQGIPFSCEHNAHLWTIKDANDGDVLACKIDGDSYILIYKQIKDGWIETYGHYYNAVDRFCVPSQMFCRDYQGALTPATKEQRDLLFAKMKEAGYEWNAEKKELKMLEKQGQKPKWNENDEHHWMMCVACVEECATQEREDFSKTIDWLKSLKQRLEVKQNESR